MWSSTTPFMVVSVTCVIVSITLFWGVCYVTLMFNNFTIRVLSLHLAVKLCLLIFGHECVQIVLRGGHVCVTQWSTSWLKWTQMTLAITTLKIIFRLHMKTQDRHLEYPNVTLNVIIQIFFLFEIYLCWRMDLCWQLRDVTLETSGHLV